MKRKLLVFGILLLLFGIFIAIRFLVFENPVKTGRLKILSSPTAGIFIDNVAYGKTPYETRLKPREYSIKLIPEGKDTQAISWSGKVTVSANSLTYVSQDLGTTALTSAGEILTISKMKETPKGETGQISVVTDPAGAIVYLDNDEKGVSPLILDEVESGDHELAVYLPGFFRISRQVNVVKNHVVNAVFKLGLDKTHKTLEQELTDKKKEASESATTDSDQNTKAAPSGKKMLKILDTPTGFLNVREEPSTGAKKITEVNPKDSYEYLEIKNNWYKIKLKDGDEGWVLGEYVQALD